MKQIQSENKLEIYYTCLFVENREDLLIKFPPKHKNIIAHHSTIAYKPENIDDVEIGKVHSIRILARVYDEFGDCLLIENTKTNKKYPHITISHADTVDRNYSNTLLENAFSKDKNKKITITEFTGVTQIEMTEGWVNMDKQEYKLAL
jgi:hypothetical protein